MKGGYAMNPVAGGVLRADSPLGWDELALGQRIRHVVRGLRKAHDSGEYKWAKLQVLRLLAPLAAVLLPSLVLAVLWLIPTETPPEPPGPIVTTECLPDAEPDPESLEPEPSVDVTGDVSDPVADDWDPAPDAAGAGDAPPGLPLQEWAGVARIPSPVMIRDGSVGRRAGAAARAAVRPDVEESVVRALRWLRHTQRPDGAWDVDPVAESEAPARWRSLAVPYTSLALLTFLAHGETPASEEFGRTVENAIRWLVKTQQPDGQWPAELIDAGKNYSQPIAAYALCEAYGMTRIPALKRAAEQAIAPILRGQNARGGWDYELKVTERDDLSLAGWCIQALKAARMAGLEGPELERALRTATRGVERLQQADGWFAYSSDTVRESRYDALTGVGVLTLQMLATTNAAAVRRGVSYLEKHHSFDWERPRTAAPLYNWYYITQARFQAGGVQWQRWEERLATGLVKAQTLLKPGATGLMATAGYWVPSRGMAGKMALRRNDRVYCTTLCALMLEVYYRHLPTYQKLSVPESGWQTDEDVAMAITVKEG